MNNSSIYSFILFLVVISLVGCTNSAKNFKDEFENSKKPETEAVHIHLKAYELLGSINEQSKDSISFQFIKAIENDNLTAYRDQNSSIALTTLGPDGDFTLIEVMMPLQDFLSAKEDQLRDENAVRFCKCAQRLAKTIAPGLEAPVKKLMDENIKDAISTQKGVLINHSGLTIKFSNFENDGIKFVSFAVSTGN